MRKIEKQKKDQHTLHVSMLTDEAKHDESLPVTLKHDSILAQRSSFLIHLLRANKRGVKF